MIVGGALIIANVPVGQPWTDQQVLLVRLGMVAVGFGVLGMVAEFLILMRAWRRRIVMLPEPIDVTPETLAGYFRTHTTVQARALVRPYLGQTLRVTGPISDVRLIGGYRSVSLKDAGIGSVHVFARFGHRWTEELKRLQLGQEITITGKIHEVEAYTLSLEDCQIVRDLGHSA